MFFCTKKSAVSWLPFVGAAPPSDKDARYKAYLVPAGRAKALRLSPLLMEPLEDHPSHVRIGKNVVNTLRLVSPLKTNNHHFLVGDTSSNGCFLNCHVSFRGCNYTNPKPEGEVYSHHGY